MRHIAFAALSALGLVTISCNISEVEKPVENPVAEKFTAIISDDQDKVYMDREANFYWTAGDEISVFGSTDNLRYRFDGKTGDNNGTFSKVSGSSSITYSKYYAIYPYDENTSSSEEGKFTCTVPERQNYVKDSFDPDAALMVATTGTIASTKLKFKNVGAYLGVKIYSATNLTVRKIYLSGNNKECLSGTGTVTLDSDGVPSIDLVSDVDDEFAGSGNSFGEEPGAAWNNDDGGSGENLSSESGEWDPETIIGGGSEGVKSSLCASNAIAGNNGRRIILDCGESGVKVGDSKETATLFTFAIPPREFTQGFTVVVEDVCGNYQVMSTHKSLNMQRASVKTMSPFEMAMAGGGIKMLSFSLLASGGQEYKGAIGGHSIIVYCPSTVDRSALTAKFKSEGIEVLVNGQQQQSGVTVNDFTAPVTYRVKNYDGDYSDYEVKFCSKKKLIACWGDSFTHENYAYPDYLPEYLGDTWSIFDGGIPGMPSNEIAARQGAIKTRVRGGFTFPSTTAGVSISGIYTDDPVLDPPGYELKYWGYGQRGLNPSIVGGVQCNVSYSSIMRKVAGDPVDVADGAEITTYGAANYRDADVIVIYMGANGGWGGARVDANLDILMKQHQAMIDFATSKKYIVLASHVHQWYGTQWGDNPVYLAKMAENFGDHVIYLKSEVNSRAIELMIKTGAISDQSELSAIDKEYIANGNWPLSFFMSATNEHPGKYGSIAMAILIYEKLIELGYLDE